MTDQVNAQYKSLYFEIRYHLSLNVTFMVCVCFDCLFLFVCFCLFVCLFFFLFFFFVLN